MQTSYNILGRVLILSFETSTTPGQPSAVTCLDNSTLASSLQEVATMIHPSVCLLMLFLQNLGTTFSWPNLPNLPVAQESTYITEATWPPHSRGTTTAIEIAGRSDEWPANVRFVAGTQNVLFYLPQDKQVHDLSSIECLALPSNAIGDCNDISVSYIQVVPGFGPCHFVGIDSASVYVSADDAIVMMALPQNILTGSCG